MRLLAILVACTAAAACAQASTYSSAKEVRMARLDYVELPVSETAGTRRFYEQAFGWTLTEFGPAYAATTTGDTDVGLDAGDGKPAAPLPVVQVADLKAAQAAVERAGGVIVKPIFAFPGGRRFHFRDPAGNELAAWQPAPE